MCPLAVYLLLAVFAAGARAETPPFPLGVDAFRVSTPRPFGHVIGDVIRRQIDLTLHDPFVLAPGSVPHPGRLSYWLELRSVQVQETDAGEQRHYRITLDYQSFYMPRDVRSLRIPVFTLTASHPGATTEVPVKAWEFTVSPLHETAGVRVVEGQAYVRPDDPPVRRDLAPRQRRLLLYGALLLVLAAGMAHEWGLWPGRTRRPFAQAWRELRRLQHAPLSASAERAAMRTLHRAFDESNGAPVFPDRLDQFFGRCPQFVPLRVDIAAFFARSRQVFFADRGAVAKGDAEVVQALARLCRRCIAVER
ncbi:MAG: hypothetical protein ACT4QB_05355 [Gammaproteobacteria bacterium]